MCFLSSCLASSRTEHAPVKTENDSPLDLKTEKLFRDYGYFTNDTEKPHITNLSSVINTHPDFFRFLKGSGLLFAIRGYQHTFECLKEKKDHPLFQGIKLEGNEPQIYSEGKWTNWTDLKEKIEYSQEKQEIVSKEDQNKIWNYFYPDGLVVKDRFISSTIEEVKIDPILELEEEQRKVLENHARKFYEGKEIPKDLLKEEGNWGYIQLFTSNNSAFASLSHVGIQLIDSEGKVYSLGFETPKYEPRFEEQNLIGTYDVKITRRDYASFDPFKTRALTTIPVTKESFQKAFDRVKKYAEKPLRFNRMRQNCTKFVVDVLQQAGIEIDAKTTFFGLLYEISPPLHAIWVVGPLLAAVRSLVKNIFAFISNYLIPRFINRSFTFLYATCSSILYRIDCIFTNIVAYFVGSTVASPSDPTVINKTRSNEKELTYFDKLFEGCCDIFTSDLATIYSPSKIVTFQKECKSTEIYHYDGSPRFLILPQKA